MQKGKEKNLKYKIVIGSRGSELALWQANYVKKELEIRTKKFLSK